MTRLLWLCSILLVKFVHSSQNLTIDWLCDAYSVHQNSLITDLSIFDIDSDDIPVLLFSPRLYAGREMSEHFAQDLFKSVIRFLNCFSLDLMELTFFPFKLLRQAYIMYPEVFESDGSFESFEDMMEIVESHALLLQQNPIDDYRAYCVRPDVFHIFQNELLVEKNGHLATVALFFDNVDASFVQYMCELVSEAEKAFAMSMSSSDEKWNVFLSNVAQYQVHLCTDRELEWSNCTLRILLSRGCFKRIACRLSIEKSPFISEHVIRAICSVGVPVDLSVFREPVRYSSKASIDKVEGFPFGMVLCMPEIFELIFVHCAVVDYVHAFTAIPLVCKHMRAHIHGRKSLLIERVCGESAFASKLFINEVNRAFLFGNGCLRLGSPWLMNDRKEILQLFIAVLIAHPIAWNSHDLYGDYIRGFPYLLLDTNFQECIYKEWSALISLVVDECDFTSWSQFESFIRRALLVANYKVTLTNCPKLPTYADLVSSMEMLMDDQKVKLRLQLDEQVVFEIMQSADVKDPVAMLRKLVPADLKNRLLYEQRFILRALSEHHFGHLRMPLASLEEILKKSKWSNVNDVADRDFMLSKLDNHVYDIGLVSGKKDVKHVIDAIMSGRVNVAKVSPVFIDDCLIYIIEHKWPVEMFREFVTIVTNGGYQLSGVKMVLVMCALEMGNKM